MNTGIEGEYMAYVGSNGQGPDILALGAERIIQFNPSHSLFEQLKKAQRSSIYLFGILSYDLKNELEKLKSNNPSFISTADLAFFEPKVVLRMDNGQIEVLKSSDDSLIDTAKAKLDALQSDSTEAIPHGVCVKRMSQDDYLYQIDSLKRHIQLGDIYEANFCQEFQVEAINLDPEEVYRQLNEKTRAPYSCYFKAGAQHLICGSPELFLKKEGSKVTSRPIKGTRKRAVDHDEDERLRTELAADQKERAENIMITDLVRNDLSKSATKGSVLVEELCGIYSFETVHQMISTVSCQVSENTSPIDIVSNCFPMGSMTGAPKIRAMELIEEHENFKRGFYSGAVGYIAPNGDFQFNVVIRSILYDEKEKKASVCAGGAITALSDPLLEYEESLLKAKAMLDVLGVERLDD